MTKPDFLSMSDEDFLNATLPEPVVVAAEPGETPASAVVAAEAEPTPAIAAEPVAAVVEEPVVADATVSADEPAVVPGPKAEPDLDPILSAKDEDLVKPGTDAEPVAKVEPGKDPVGSKDPAAAKDPAPAVAAAVAAPVDYEAFYKQVMTPFKANGKLVEPKTVDEAIRLMQMGAGFGKKIQDMQPHLKTLRMLEKNDLLDEGKLSLLIEVNNKNPDAIKKIIAESGIDPLDINTQDNISYKPVSHAVSDEEVAFNEALAEVNAQPTGGVTLEHINQTWDAQSKAVLWESPQLLGVIQSQRETGIYDLITAEIDRQKTFGLIPQNASFLQAYKIAGDALVAANAFQASPEVPATPVAATAPAAPVAAQVIATRTEAPKPAVVSSEQARAAAPSPTTARKAATFINPLDMADDEFLKQFAGRL